MQKILVSLHMLWVGGKVRWCEERDLIRIDVCRWSEKWSTVRLSQQLTITLLDCLKRRRYWHAFRRDIVLSPARIIRSQQQFHNLAQMCRKIVVKIRVLVLVFYLVLLKLGERPVLMLGGLGADPLNPIGTSISTTMNTNFTTTQISVRAVKSFARYLCAYTYALHIDVQLLRMWPSASSP